MAWGPGCYLAPAVKYPISKTPLKGTIWVVINYVCMPEKCLTLMAVLLINQVTVCPLGVRRSPSEMAEGDVDVANSCGPYYINNLSYSEEDFDKLVNLSYYNVQNNKDLILQALRAAVERKKQQKKQQPLQKPPPARNDGMGVPNTEASQHLPNYSAVGKMK